MGEEWLQRKRHEERDESEENSTCTISKISLSPPAHHYVHGSRWLDGSQSGYFVQDIKCVTCVFLQAAAVIMNSRPQIVSFACRIGVERREGK